MPDEKHTSLRIPLPTVSAIDAACDARVGKVSFNTWVLEAIAEKLARETHERSSQGVRKGAQDA